ncbi:hypothetical protein Saso_71990 [Streptomyces asoensis]|uniref:ABC transporter domain-containing protein n=1 Tax=Streptomyces asoensis TaxID=249586 RepID=A0ABQ3SBP6_9ACTN|nr:hypothetical protein GCM10010496_20890 [Streptomyces asoensis]GHI65549.1 hypothetical protein Saso_71990 [Streptomyces asoensis]
MDGVSLTVRHGETLGVVGESGSDRATLGRMPVGLLEPTAGEIRYEGRVPSGVDPTVQMVFQDPVSSLDPGRSEGETVADPLRARGVREGRGARQGAREETPGARGARGGALRPLPARVQRRSAPTRRHRPGASRRPARHRPRRARLGARRAGSRPTPESRTTRVA